MGWRTTRRLAATTLASALVLATVAPSSAPATADSDDSFSFRLAGADRHETAALIATASRDQASTVYIARSDTFADALAAGTLDGPVLLVPAASDVPPAAVRDAVDELDARRVVALGGTNAVSEAMLAAVAAGRATSRIAGSNRYETAAAIARARYRTIPPKVYLASALDQSPDAVSGGVVRDGVILLVAPDGSVPMATRDAIDEFDPPEVIALGGVNAIPEATLIESAAGRPTSRWAGTSRYETSAAIAAAAFEPNQPDMRTAYLARGDRFVDAVAAAAVPDGPVLLVPSCGDLPATTADVLRDLAPPTVTALGGATTVCDSILQQARDAARQGAQIPDQPGWFSAAPAGTPEHDDSHEGALVLSRAKDDAEFLPDFVDLVDISPDGRWVMFYAFTNASGELDLSRESATGSGVVLYDLERHSIVPTPPAASNPPITTPDGRALGAHAGTTGMLFNYTSLWRSVADDARVAVPFVHYVGDELWGTTGVWDDVTGRWTHYGVWRYRRAPDDDTSPTGVAATTLLSNDGRFVVGPHSATLDAPITLGVWDTTTGAFVRDLGVGRVFAADASRQRVVIGQTDWTREQFAVVDLAGPDPAHSSHPAFTVVTRSGAHAVTPGADGGLVDLATGEVSRPGNLDETWSAGGNGAGVTVWSRTIDGVREAMWLADVDVLDGGDARPLSFPADCQIRPAPVLYAGRCQTTLQQFPYQGRRYVLAWPGPTD